MRKLSIAFAVLASLAAASPAQAQGKKKTTSSAPAARVSAPSSTMHNQISVWGILAYRYAFSNGYGIGARYQYVVVPEGVLHLGNGIRDEIGIEGGLDFTNYSFDIGVPGFGNFDYSYNRFDFVVGATWNFWLTPKVAVYPKLDLGFGFGSFSSDAGSDVDPDVDPLFFQVAAGVVYKLDRLFLRAELGSEMLRAGVSFNF